MSGFALAKEAKTPIPTFTATQCRNQTIDEIRSMMDRTLKEFEFEICDALTMEQIRYSILARFNQKFVLTSKVDWGTLSVEFLNSDGRGVRATFDVRFLYPFGHNERIISTIGC